MVNHYLMKRYFSLVCLLYCTYLSSNSQTFTDSNLPIVIINTDGGANIPDSPGILASMKIIFRGDGLRNYPTGQDTTGYLNYNGRMNNKLIK